MLIARQITRLRPFPYFTRALSSASSEGNLLKDVYLSRLNAQYEAKAKAQSATTTADPVKPWTAPVIEQPPALDLNFAKELEAYKADAPAQEQTGSSVDSSKSDETFWQEFFEEPQTESEAEAH